MTTESSTRARELPQPERDRWQPLRAGLVNLYRYDDEEFHFTDGRLLLRGNNGTGKTRVLALTLPFLLDGEVRPGRVEPDGDSSRRFEWHLLMDRYPERTGYTWLELGRRDPEHRAHYLTIGCGARAVAGHQGLRGRWFFVTELRIGQELSLAADGVPLSRDRLDEALAGRGVVYDNASDYRRTIDDRLYQLGGHRYRALVDLLIELRRPQLSRELDEARLSRALSDALPPIEPSVLDDVAESYRDLERERQGLVDHEETARAVAEFAATYRSHVELAAARLADAVRSAHTRYDKAQGSVREAQARLDAALQALQAAAATLESLAAERHRLEGEKAGLEASEAMRTAEALERLREQHEHSERVAAQAEDDARRVGDEAQERAQIQTAAAEALRLADEQHHGALVQARAAARALGMADELERAWRDGDGKLARTRLVRDVDGLNQARRLLSEWDEKVRRARTEADKARQRAEDTEHQRDVAQQAVEAADDTAGAEREAFRAAVRAHGRALTECRVALDALLDEVGRWLEEPDGPEPYGRALAEAAAARTNELADARAALVEERRQLEARKSVLAAEAQALEKGGELVPPAPAHRRADARVGRPGAPLWAVCDFEASLAPSERAGLEAALEASGLLDAWIHPDGRLTPAADGDTSFLAAPGEVQAPHLGELLRPAIDGDNAAAAHLDAAAVAAALSQVGVRVRTSGGDNSAEDSAGAQERSPRCWVSAEGRWRNGPVHGAHCKPAAEHIGAGARAAARRLRLDAIRVELAELDRTVEGLDARLRGIDAARARVQAERSSSPSPDAVRSTSVAARQRRSDLAAARRIVAEAQVALLERERGAETAVSGREQAARDCGLTAWIERSGELTEAIHAYARASDALCFRWDAAQERRVQMQAATTQAAAAAAHAERARQRALDERGFAERLANERRVLEETQGAAVSELFAQLARVRGGLQALAERERATQQEKERAIGERGSSEGKLEEARGQLAECDTARAVELGRLRAFAHDGLLAPLGGELGTAIGPEAADTQVLELARSVARAVGDVPRDDAARDRLQSRVHEAFQRLHTALSSHDYLPAAETRHGVLTVRVPFQGRECDLVELEQRLQSEIAQRRQLLTAREREVIENFLLDEAAGALHELLHRAEEWLATVNRELAERPMSTGMALRFVWQPVEEAPEGLREARERLLRPLHAWSAEDRDALGAFLQRRIQAVREELPSATWHEQLAAALDYRAWHQFVIERRQDGRWSRLTRRTHGTGSGGEKAVALTLPLFAAAAAHYHGSPQAPRLIMLDEVFVGIDSDMRRNCMGLLAAFDLDVVMTSEREWGCYDTVPGLSIYQLAADAESDCVATTRYVWTGRSRIRVEPSA